MMNRRLRRPIWLGTLVAVWCLALQTHVGRAADAELSSFAELEKIEAAFTALGEKLAPSVVSIRAHRRLSTINPKRTYSNKRDLLVTAAGSGVIIRSDGKILTNNHVVQGAELIEVVLHDQRAFEAVALHSDLRSDLAILTIDAHDLEPARLGDLSRVKQGQWAIAMGNPYGHSRDGHAAMTYGVVSALGRSLPELGSRVQYYGNLIQTDADINPGNSGGPLFNIYGEMIGINTAISTRSGSSDGVGFAIPISHRTRAIFETLLEKKAVEYGFLGVELKRVQRRGRSGRRTGAIVKKIEPDTPAERASLRADDRIVRFNGTRIRDNNDLIRIVGATAIGQSALIEYVRDGQTRTCEVDLEKFPESTPAQVRLLLAFRGMEIGAIDPARRRRFDLDRSANGFVVFDVDSDSPAARAGVEPGAIVTRIGPAAITQFDELRQAIRQAKGAVTIIADGKPITVEPSDD